MYTKIEKCRICGNEQLRPIIHLGEQVLTGVFPRKKNTLITKGPLELVMCEGKNSCGLLQLRHSYDSNEMYRNNYGYRSSLNQSMVKHLRRRVEHLLGIVSLKKGDLVIDIGSNDSTLLQGYPQQDLLLVGIDPAGGRFEKYYPDHIQLIPEFFAGELIERNFPGKKAKVVTSIAMFYDLESPIDFMRQIYDVLDEDGVWVFEQSYMPTMLERNSYDTICHEHLEYYALQQIKWMADKVGFKILDVEFNDINGGSFTVVVAKNANKRLKENKALVNGILKEEKLKGLSTLKPYDAFKSRVYKSRDDLNAFVRDVQKRGELLLGYGASTKGNVILQFCGLTAKEIPCIAEVNQDKFGCFTPGTKIPIVSEAEAKAKKPDYFLVLPWHFKENIVQREKLFLDSGGALVMPLPGIEVVALNKKRVK